MENNVYKELWHELMDKLIDLQINKHYPVKIWIDNYLEYNHGEDN